MTWLPDGNILIALVVASHQDHQRANAWFHGLSSAQFATCSVTQGTVLRLYLKYTATATPSEAWQVLETLSKDPRHVFWDDGFSYLGVPSKNLQGHRQITDAWLAELARRHRGKIATMDRGLAADQPDVAVLIP